MSRFNIEEMPNPYLGLRVWVVRDNDRAVDLAASRDDAVIRLRQYKEYIAEGCEHPSMKATIEGPDLDVTLECVDCGMVGEFSIDMDEIEWIGQQP